MLDFKTIKKEMAPNSKNNVGRNKSVRLKAL
jgi:hypothetical protein